MSRTRDSLLTWLIHVHQFDVECAFAGLSGKRKYRWDACKGRVAVEYSGMGPGHRWTAGVTRDYRKIAEGQLAGYTVIVCNHEMTNDGSCMDLIERALEGEVGDDEVKDWCAEENRLWASFDSRDTYEQWKRANRCCRWHLTEARREQEKSPAPDEEAEPLPPWW